MTTGELPINDKHPGAFSDPVWGTGQALVLAATLGLIGGFALLPEPSLNLLWGILIPILPITFLLGTGMWRSICPLATLNMLPNPWAGRRDVSVKGARFASVVGIVLLVVMVPARRFLFNTNGPVLAATVLTVAVLAVVLGVVYDAKAGFCNGICPILPVERLYGQYPLLRTQNPRCPSCTVCTPGTCIDLAPARSLLETIGATSPASEQAWLRRPLGAFAAAFPGFVMGYYTTADGPISSAGSVYLNVAAYAAVSYAIVAAVTMLAGIDFQVMLPMLAATAVGIYYWYAAPLIAAALGTTAAVAVGIRVVALILVVAWLGAALRAPASKRMEVAL